MRLSRLSVRNFRNHQETCLELSPGPTLLLGANGQGKTNLAEAVGYLANQSSHRVFSDTALIRQGSDQAHISAVAVESGRMTTLELELHTGRGNRARLNRSPVRPRETLGLVRCVMFAPEDVMLIRGDPELRRRYLDDLAGQLTPRLAGTRASYERAVRQRTNLLKSISAVRRNTVGARTAEMLSTLEDWDAHLAKFGAELLAARLDLVGVLAGQVPAAYESVAASGPRATIEYRSSLGSACPDPGKVTGSDRVGLTDHLVELMLAGLREVRDAELARGVCLLGPHRDDLVLSLDGLPARGYASYGEICSLALALRISAYRILTERDSDPPILVLDDVFAELDEGRRERLARLAAEAEQVLLTAAVPSDVPGQLSAERYEVIAGNVRPYRS